MEHGMQCQVPLGLLWLHARCRKCNDPATTEATRCLDALNVPHPESHPPHATCSLSCRPYARTKVFGLAQINIHTPEAFKDAFHDLLPICKRAVVSQHCKATDAMATLGLALSSSYFAHQALLPTHCCTGTLPVHPAAVLQVLLFPVLCWRLHPEATECTARPSHRPWPASLPSCLRPVCAGNAVRTRHNISRCTLSGVPWPSRLCSSFASRTWLQCWRSLCQSRSPSSCVPIPSYACSSSVMTWRLRTWTIAAGSHSTLIPTYPTWLWPTTASMTACAQTKRGPSVNVSMTGAWVLPATSTG